MTLLVLDLGSSSTRAKLFDDALGEVPGGMSTRRYQFTTTPPGAAVIDTDLVRTQTEACIDEILQHPAARSIRAVAAGAFTGTMVGIDRAGQPITPLYTYAETRSAADVHILNKQIDPAAAHQRTGCVNHSAYLPARLHWLRRTEPELYSQVVRWDDIGAYLYRHWFGRSVTSYSLASWSGLLNRATLTWDAGWLALLGLDGGIFPTLGDYDDVQQGLLDSYATRWPLLRDVPFCLTVGDGAAANVGSGAVDRTHMGLTVGTTAALRMITDDELPAVPPGLWGYRLDRRHHVIGGATIEGGNIFRWARDTLRLPDEETIEQALTTRSADAHGLTFLPLLGGERSPGWVAEATGAIAGLRLSTTPLDILQAAFEGVALRIALIAERLRPLTVPGAAVMAGGGSITASRALAQIMADALDQPVSLIADGETTARGAALLAARTLGLSSLEATPPAIEILLLPRPEHVQALRGALERQRILYEQTVVSRN